MASLRNKAIAFPLAFLAAAFIIADFALFFAEGEIAASVLTIEFIIYVFAIPASLFYAKSLVKPIADLVPQATGIAEGRLEVSYHGKKVVPDELESLAHAINEIAEKQSKDLAAIRKLERIRSEFLGNVSHELRTPIFAVQGFIETLLDGAIDDPKVNRDFLERAHLQAERLNALLNDLIDISRIESGEMRMSFRFFDLQAFLRDVVLEMQPIAEHKSIILTYSTNQQGEIEVFGDKERIKQVMVNLTDNAIKYTNNGGTVNIKVAVDTPNSNAVTVSVTDNGIGISEEHLPRLFERFYRVDKDRSRSTPGGTGLGLAICKHIIEAHKSTITVKSVPGKGSEFSFVLSKKIF